MPSVTARRGFSIFDAEGLPPCGAIGDHKKGVDGGLTWRLDSRPKRCRAPRLAAVARTLTPKALPACGVIGNHQKKELDDGLTWRLESRSKRCRASRLAGVVQLTRVRACVLRPGARRSRVGEIAGGALRVSGNGEYCSVVRTLTPKALPACGVIGDHQKKKSMMD
jgi:hypothetical protein